jgi:hypothetical protein
MTKPNGDYVVGTVTLILPMQNRKQRRARLYPAAGKLKATHAISSGLQSSLSLGLCIFAMEMPTRTWARAKEHAGPALRCKPC